MGNVCIEKMDAADGILLGSPTYVADVSPEIKALIDRACLVSKANIGIGREPGEVEKDEEGIQTMKDLGRNMAWLLKKIHAQG